QCRRRRIHHEAVRSRNHRSQVRAGRAALTVCCPRPHPSAVSLYRRNVMVSLAPDEMRKERDAYRVMVVDDSAVIRGLIARWLDADPRITVVATAHNGLMALRNLKSSGAEVVILDVEMPEMDGMTALPKMIELVPNLQAIMASTLT